MTGTDFEKYSETYKNLLRSSFGAFRNSEDVFDSIKLSCITHWVVEKQKTYDILDFGCGIGKLTGLMAEELRQSAIYGYDISLKSLAVAKKEHRGKSNVYFIEGFIKDQKFDVIVIANVLHHIEPLQRADTLLSIKRLMKHGGKLVIFEHNPINPLTRIVVSRCPFDDDAELIMIHDLMKITKACGFDVERKAYTAFFPWHSSLLRKLERLLIHLPLGAQYMLSLV